MIINNVTYSKAKEKIFSNLLNYQFGYTYSEGLEFTSNGDGTCYVSGIGTCTDTDIIIPEKSPQDDTVTAIGDEAFDQATQIRTMAIPSSVTNIGQSAFWGCTSLTSIVIPESVTSIGDVAFENCTSLESIVIPSSVTSIGEDAFYQCTNLATVNLTAFVSGTTIPTLGTNVFPRQASTKLLVAAGRASDFKSATNWAEYGSNPDQYEEAAAAFTQVYPAKDGDYTTLSNMDTSKKYTIAEYGSGQWYLLCEFEYDSSNSEWVGINVTENTEIISNNETSIKFYIGNDVFSEWKSCATLEGSSFATASDFSGLTAAQNYSYWKCYIEGTLITLADGTRKSVEEITYEDDLLVWNFYEGRFDSAKPKWIKIPQEAGEYNEVIFSDGTVLGLIGSNHPGDKKFHRIYNKDEKKFTWTGTDHTPNGTSSFTDSGKDVTVLEQNIVYRNVKFYNIITEKHFNVFANGILTSCRLSNMYPIGENMKYDTSFPAAFTAEDEEKYIAKIQSIKKEKTI